MPGAPLGALGRFWAPLGALGLLRAPRLGALGLFRALLGAAGRSILGRPQAPDKKLVVRLRKCLDSTTFCFREGVVFSKV